MTEKGDCARRARTRVDLSAPATLQSAAQQGVQLRVDLSFLLEHVEEQLVLRGAVDLRLVQPALHHLQLGVLLSRLQTLSPGTAERLSQSSF